MTCLRHAIFITHYFIDLHTRKQQKPFFACNHKSFMIKNIMKTTPESIREYFAAIGKKGDSRSRRTLPPEQAKSMLKVREARRAFRKYHR